MNIPILSNLVELVNLYWPWMIIAVVILGLIFSNTWDYAFHAGWKQGFKEGLEQRDPERPSGNHEQRTYRPGEIDR